MPMKRMKRPSKQFTFQKSADDVKAEKLEKKALPLAYNTYQESRAAANSKKQQPNQDVDKMQKPSDKNPDD